MFKSFFVVVAGLCFASDFCVVSGQSNPRESKSRESARQLLDVARRGLNLVERKVPGSGEAYVDVWTWSKRVLNAELAMSRNREERVVARERYLQQTIKLERAARRLLEQQVMLDEQVLEAEYHRCEAQADLDAERQTNVQSRK